MGELVEGSGGVTFRYLDLERLEPARDDGFSEYPGLPIESPDSERIAPDVLIRRLPPRERTDFPDLLTRFGLPADRDYTDLTLLAYTGARLTGDSFSICETFDGFEGRFSYVFDVAGSRHYVDYSELEKSDAIFFEREPTNERDPNAVRLARGNGNTVGYVNRLQAETVGQWIDNGSVTGSVFRVNGRIQYPRLFVQADIETST
ncbi:MAG: HIRAN domain-containing protein [Rhodobacter sp.]|nr:HIRAN domain-containing protein [Rhodobacter sp.]